MRTVLAMLLGALLGAALPAGAATSAPGNPETIEVNAVRNPEVRKYAAILAGLDAFERHHGMAPKVPRLRFRVEPRGKTPYDAALAVRLEGADDFLLPLTLAPDNTLVVPRSEAAADARSELVVNRKRRDVRVRPLVRTPGLPEHVRRLGDLRLECQVMVAIGKEELGLMRSLLVNSVLLTTDWCSFFNEKREGFGFDAPLPLARATLREGERSVELAHEGRSFRTALNDAAWSDEALIELAFAAPDAVAETLIGTAGETPRTGP